MHHVQFSSFAEFVDHENQLVSVLRLQRPVNFIGAQLSELEVVSHCLANVCEDRPLAVERGHHFARLAAHVRIRRADQILAS